MSLDQAEEFNANEALYLSRPKGYTVLNSSPQEYVLTYGGNSFRVPPRTEIVEQHPKFPNDPSVPYSACYRDTSEYIPGSLVIRDLGQRKEGNKGEDGVGIEFNIQLTAEMFLKGVFQVDEHDNITGMPYKKGLSILPGEPTKEQVVKADADGKARYRAWLLRNAATVIRDHENRNHSARKSELPPIPDSVEVRAAREILEKESRTTVQSLYDNVVKEERVVEKQIQQPPQDIQEISDERLAALLADRQHVLMDPKLRKELSEDFNISKRKVSKSKQKSRPKAGRNSKSRKSAAIQVPVD